MTIEQRLYHAARELREVHIDVPPLGRPPRPARRTRLQAVAAPMLFLAGSVLAMGVLRQADVEPVRSDIPVASTAVGEPAPATDAPSRQPPAIAAPTARAEIEAIAKFVNDHNVQAPPEPAPTAEPVVPIEQSGPN